MTEAVRLVIWDLDETFWHGTVTEGGIQYSQENHEIVVELARRGIMSSICSKNDPETVREILSSTQIWSYFIFPSISWEPKGPRIVALIDAVQLRPETVLLIDDNPSNLNEARHFVPKLQVAGPEILATLLKVPEFKGKDDSTLTRLAQYKLLEKRKTDEVTAGGNNTEFLRSSDITVYVEHDVERHLDRAIELINRTNQLNFTKLRLSEDTDQARAELTDLLRRPNVQAGLVRVVDKYGDYGFCGLYVTVAHVMQHKILHHYCFSCRTLGMGVESYVYQILGRPELSIRGEVLSNPISDPEVNWIRTVDALAPDGKHMAASLAGGIYLRGGCDLMVVEHYARMLASDVVGEYNVERNGIALRLDHSLIARHAIEGLPASAVRAFTCLGYRSEDFESKILTERPHGVWVMSNTPDFWVPVFRHMKTGALIPFFCMDLGGCNYLQIPREERAQRIKNPHMLEAIDYLEHNFCYEGLIGESDFKDNLRIIFGNVPASSELLVILNKGYFGKYDVPEAAARDTINVNQWTADVAREFHNVKIVPITQFVDTPDDISDDQVHFNRMVYFRLFNYTKERASKQRAPNLNKPTLAGFR